MRDKKIVSWHNMIPYPTFDFVRLFSLEVQYIKIWESIYMARFKTEIVKLE